LKNQHITQHGLIIGDFNKGGVIFIDGPALNGIAGDGNGALCSEAFDFALPLFFKSRLARFILFLLFAPVCITSSIPNGSLFRAAVRGSTTCSVPFIDSAVFSTAVVTHFIPLFFYCGLQKLRIDDSFRQAAGNALAVGFKYFFWAAQT
jgi:hypothetical protein